MQSFGWVGWWVVKDSLPTRWYQGEQLETPFSPTWIGWLFSNPVDIRVWGVCTTNPVALFCISLGAQQWFGIYLSLSPLIWQRHEEWGVAAKAVHWKYLQACSSNSPNYAQWWCDLYGCLDRETKERGDQILKVFSWNIGKNCSGQWIFNVDSHICRIHNGKTELIGSTSQFSHTCFI